MLPIGSEALLLRARNAHFTRQKERQRSVARVARRLALLSAYGFRGQLHLEAETVHSACSQLRWS